ncbi:MAG: hypothetical protein AB8I08_24390 [Sandaracinaceae bacterium]
MAPPALKPPARARRIRALTERTRVALTDNAIRELFRSAEVLTEGGLDSSNGWFGSVMVTFDLARLVSRSRDLDTPAQLARFVDAIEGSVRVRIRAHRLACAEIYRRFPDRDVGTVNLESRFRREGDQLLLDIDLEAAIDLPKVESGT